MRRYLRLSSLTEAPTPNSGATGVPTPDKTGALVRHAMVAISKRGFDAKDARKIATATMKHDGFLKPDGKVTQKGSQRNMKHAMEKDNAAKQRAYDQLHADESRNQLRVEDSLEEIKSIIGSHVAEDQRTIEGWVRWFSIKENMDSIDTRSVTEVLDKSCSMEAFKKNVKTEKDSGSPIAQAVAIAYSTLKSACGVKSDKKMTPSQIVGH